MSSACERVEIRTDFVPGESPATAHENHREDTVLDTTPDACLWAFPANFDDVLADRELGFDRDPTG